MQRIRLTFRIALCVALCIAQYFALGAPAARAQPVDRILLNGAIVTQNAWLANMDSQRATLMPLFAQTYGQDAAVWWTRWRVFFLSCAELFGYDRGQQWWVSHYLFQPRP